MGWNFRLRNEASRVGGRQGLQPPPGTPAVAAPKPERVWFEAQGAPVVERNRYFLICLGLLFALCAACIALALMVPLKTVVPFVLEKTDEGAVQPAFRTAQQYQPGSPEKRYFIAQWARQLLTIDPHLTERYLSEAYRVTRGKATVEFTDWVQRTAPMAELKRDPTLTRTVSISSVSLIQDQVALVRVSTERRNAGNPMAGREKFILTIHFATVPPKSEEELLSNPVGLYVTHFLVNADLEK
ncbi:MAG: type IV secretion system protein [Betaproteobacteria bacterium]|nr:type IV secretion system protein [Betaproteobacteria bacterium]